MNIVWQMVRQYLGGLALGKLALGLPTPYRSGAIAAIASLVLLWPGFTLPAQATSVYEVPTLEAGSETVLVDEAQVLSRLNSGQISARARELAQKTDTEIRFVTFRRLDYEVTIDQFTKDLFARWYPTPEAQAKQVLIALDVVSNTVGIQVGPEVLPALTPAIAQSITQETMLIPMRKGEKYNQALLDATSRLRAVLSGEPDPGPPLVVDTVQVEGTFATPEETKNSNGTLIVIVLLIVATVVPMVTYFIYVR